ncbi:MAG TPA: 50S ribosomal protein L9 [Henriciella marina]|uniref:50S ribosomal protein L9 n=1 Tax=Henriciella sp. TaxID=1968823 RepID=UPI0017F1C218|nr:50S ribosomal protein L9 [Henriciella sp.]HIG21448.1 50S ribosomal protein L9 [Henriciella sp.]HIK63686.1 50S ribosomal protein L9 [Henriciella marina]
MDIILLERVENLGELGEEVTVKNGFARNFLLPRGKALIANDRNRARFAAERDLIEKRNADAREEAKQTGNSMDGAEVVLIRQSSDTGNLYGSVSTRDIVDALAEKDFKVRRGQIKLDQPIKTIGIYELGVRLHAEVLVEITVNVARSMEEAERQAAGENVIETIQAEQQGAAAEQSAELAEASAEREDATREGGDEE